jgi:hypothetical protein
MQAPVLAWNLSNGFSSFGFVLGGRHGGLASPLDGLVPLLISVPLFLSPFLLWPMVGFALGRGARAEEAPARAVFWVSTLVMLALATRTTALFHWNLVAYLALLGYAAFHFRNRWLYGLHVLYGVVFLAGVAVNYVVAPVGDVLRFRDEASAWVYGWDEMAETVAAARQAHGARFVATTDYATAALLAFALRDRDVTSLSPQTDQFDFWFDAGAHAGQDAILYTDSFRGLTAAVAARFESVTLIESVAAERFGRPLGVREIHLARGFKGAQ